MGVNLASLIDRPPLGNKPLELVEVLLAALVEVPQLEVLLDEVRVGALGDFVLEEVYVSISARPVELGWFVRRRSWCSARFPAGS